MNYVRNYFISERSNATPDGFIRGKAFVRVKPEAGWFGLDIVRDQINGLVYGKRIYLEFVAAELEPGSEIAKPTIKAYAHRRRSYANHDLCYEASFLIPGEFGIIGAILVENEQHREMFVNDIFIHQGTFDIVHITCNSWVNSKFNNSESRIFFTNKSYLPSLTPNGLKELRNKELEAIRGDVSGERTSNERIYDYDVYNDLGVSFDAAGDQVARPVLGGEKRPYPRRCRTGRPKSGEDEDHQPLESRSSNFYIPRDEAFSDIKSSSFAAKKFAARLHTFIPIIESYLTDKHSPFPDFTHIDSLYDNQESRHDLKSIGSLKRFIVRLITSHLGDIIFRFETPELIKRDKFSWLRDEEFGRQTLAGLNPCTIRLVKKWPMRSKLDAHVYGRKKSLITMKIIVDAIREQAEHTTHEELITDEKPITDDEESVTDDEESITDDEEPIADEERIFFIKVLKGKKLFVLDYHDLLLPFVNKVRSDDKKTTLYASRTIFFLTATGTLKPLAIELTRPKGIDNNGSPISQWRKVFTPCRDASCMWLWRFAKAHVIAHDSGYHQLVSHWVRTHAATEPYIIASNRQLSAMHPIYRLLHPYFRYTMAINARARLSLINAGGVIESTFSPTLHCTEFSSHAYDKLWRFDKEGLPADLIERGMAVEDPTVVPHGIKLVIEDYPYASDGLELWGEIKTWVSDYVNHYYPESSLVEGDRELQSWWEEIRTVGHGDKKNESWWPTLKTQKDLIETLTTIIWVTSGHHAAVNFGQYTYAGYFPNRPTIIRKTMPNEPNSDPKNEYMQMFLKHPERALMETFPTRIQATKVMATLDVLSDHSKDEEYIGKDIQAFWEEDPTIKTKFEKFQKQIENLVGKFDSKNKKEGNHNRNGVGIVPYELLKPFSADGMTRIGVPNSISI